MDIVQDGQGFLWIGTWNGLFKYDGYAFKGYRHDPTDSLSLSYDWAETIYIDREGTYWIGTNGGGLNRFDPEREVFESFRHDPDTPTTISSDEVIQIFEDREGVFWVGTGRGLNRFDRDSGHFTRYVYDPDDTAGLLGDQVRDIHEDEEGVLWIATGNPFVPGRPGALNRYNREDGTFTSYQVDSSDCTGNCTHVLAIHTDMSGRFWISTWGRGLYEFDRQSGTFDPLRVLDDIPSDPNRDRGLGVTTITEEPKTGALWLGAYGGGIYRYDPATGTASNYTVDPNDPFSLNDGRVWELTFDREDNLWVGTHSGLHKTDPVGKVSRYALGGSDAALSGNEWVTGIIEDEKGLLWIGTSEMRLLAWDRASDQWTSYQPPADRCLSWYLPGTSLSASRSGHLWVATSCGLYAFDREVGTFVTYPHDLSALGERYAADPIDIVEEADGHLWLSVLPGALRLNPTDGTFVEYRHDPEDPGSLSFDETTTAMLDREGNIWIGTARGLNRFDPETESFTRFLTDREGQNVSTTRIWEDEGLWLATDVLGLVHLDPYTGAHTSYTVRDGLHTNTLFDLARDDAGYFWVLSGQGISVFHPQTSTARTYEYGTDGFVPMQSRRRAVHARADGTLLLGGRGGLNVFDPARYRPRLVPPEVLLTDVRVFDRRLVPGPGRLLDQPLAETEHLSLSHAQNDLTFEFVGLNFSDPKLTRYRYRLENYDTDWVEARTQRSARYTNLSPGRYTFRVTAASGAGVWNENGATLDFTIAPPWWRTAWAYGLFAVLLGGVLWGARRYEMNRLRLKHSAQLEHAEAESLRSLDRAKSQFFTNISHEFRTPLTLILGPVTDAIERGHDLPQNQLPIIRRNGERLLRLVNQLLDLARLEAGGMMLQTDQADLVPFLKGVLYSFESQAEQDEIALQFESDRPHIVLPFERDKLEQVFYNLVGNAFKYTPAGGTISVVCTVRDDAFAEIAVRDTGSGIQPEHLPHLFDRFFQSSSDESRAEHGSGIGLALTKALVELHGGTIAVRSEVDAGTTFTVGLPLGTALPSGDGATDVLTQEDVPPLHSERTAPLTVEGPAFSRDDDNGSEETAGIDSADEEGAVVLIVEDNADVRAYVRYHLESAYTVLEAPDGADGIALAREAIPDLIVTDVMMPEVDGYGLVHAMRHDERTSHIPIVMLTAKASEDDKLEGLDTGVDDYLLKPFSPRELRARVRNLIAQRRLLRERFKTATVIRPAEVTAVSLDQEFLTRTVAVIDEHFEDSAFAVTDLAEEVGLSVSQLNRKLNALVGQSAGQLVRSMRLQRAADLLAQEAGTVAEIAYRVGFNSQSHFSTSFKKQFGVTPSAYTA